MTRLDIELVNRQICETRSKAQMEIKNSNILVNGKIVKTGDASLAKEIEENGYEKYKKLG